MDDFTADWLARVGNDGRAAGRGGEAGAYQGENHGSELHYRACQSGIGEEEMVSERGVFIDTAEAGMYRVNILFQLACPSFSVPSHFFHQLTLI